MDSVTTNIVALWTAVGIEAVVIVLLVRQLGLVMLRLPSMPPLAAAQGLEVGTRAPEFRALNLEGSETPALESVAPDGMLVFFVSPTCHPCHKLLPEVSALSKEVVGRGIDIVLVSSGEVETNKELLRQFELDVPLFLQDEEQAVAKLYEVEEITPFVFAVDAEKRIRFKGIVNDEEQLAQVVSILRAPYVEHDPARSGQGMDLREGM